MRRSSRRARRRTLFATTAGPRSEPDLELAPVATDAVLAVGEPAHMTDLALDEFVIDDDDYPEVSVAQRRVQPAASEPDRVDDIDQWLEEFAVSDCIDVFPH